MGEILQKFWSELVVFAFAVVGTKGLDHVLNKRRGRAYVKALEIENDEKIAKKWREYAEKIESRLDTNEIAIQTLKRQHEECEKTTIVLQREIEELRKIIP
jgi:hypothetical protein